MLPLLRIFPRGALVTVADRLEREMPLAGAVGEERACPRCTLIYLLAGMEQEFGVDTGLLPSCGVLTADRFADLYLGILSGKQYTQTWARIDLQTLTESAIECAGWVALSEPVDVVAALRKAAAEKANG